MRYGKITVYLFTAFFLALAALLYAPQESEPETVLPLFITVQSSEATEEIHGWEKEPGEYFFFLPSYAKFTQAEIHIDRNTEVCMNDQILPDGTSCDIFSPDQPYTLCCTSNGETHCFSVTFLQSAEIPSLYIDVTSGNMDYIHALKGNEESGTMRLYTADGTRNYSGRLESVSGRGNATWTHEKKPYSLKLTAEADLLGMGSAQKWILLANAADRSNLRNMIVYDFAEAIGLPYTPECEWVDLYLNGEYAGLYLLCERNEIHSQRVDLEESSSFLVSQELEWRLKNQGYPYISTESGAYLRIHYSAFNSTSLLEIWQSAENAIFAEDGIDPITRKSWTELIDPESWAEKYLIEEVFGNLDAGNVSQYFYYDKSRASEKIYAGPIWDYDMAIGNPITEQQYEPNTFYANTSEATSWFSSLYQKEEFFSRVTKLYQTVFRPLLENLLNNKLDQYVTYISQAAKLNQVRWSTPDTDGEAEYIRAYLTERMAFLNSLWVDGVEYCTVLVDQGSDKGSVCYAVKPGECLASLPAYVESPDILGWYYVNSEEPFDITQPIYENMKIYLKPAYDYEEGISPFQYAPAAALVVLLMGLALTDILRLKRSGRQKHERTKISP